MNTIDGDFELMGDLPREDPAVVERRRARNNEITKKLGSYLLKGYCMLSDACPECDCILLRTPDRELLCVGCAEVDVENKVEVKKEEIDEQHVTTAEKPKKVHQKNKKKRNKKTPSVSESEQEKSTNYSQQLEKKLKWAVDELSKSDSPNRINAMCTVINKLTETIKALKDYESSLV